MNPPEKNHPLQKSQIPPDHRITEEQRQDNSDGDRRAERDFPILPKACEGESDQAGNDQAQKAAECSEVQSCHKEQLDVSAAKAFLAGNFVKYKGQNQKAAAEKERSAKVSCQASKCSSRERACFLRSEIGAGKTAGKPKLNKRKGHSINHQCSSKKPVGYRVGLQIYQRQHEKNADKRNCTQQLPAYAVTENAAKP